MMDNKFYRELWVKAQEIAKEKYNEEFGGDSWNEADKYEREDWVFTEYKRLVEERKEMEKTKNVKVNNATTNTNSNKKGNDIMMNKNTEKRMETLKANGIDTTNFFDLSMRIPMGADVRILVNGKEMVVGNGNIPTVTTAGIHGGNVNGITSGYTPSINIPVYGNAMTNVNTYANDAIAQNIIENGYVKNSKLFRRWITAQTFRMLNYQSWRNPNRKGWEVCMKDRYGYNYQFEMLLEEIRVLSILQKEDYDAFTERTHFFNLDVAVDTVKDYERRLKKYINKNIKTHPRKYRNQPYVKLARYGNVFIKDLREKVYKPISNKIDDLIVGAAMGDYAIFYKDLKDFMDNYYNKLPYETTKAAEWKDAFKGSGAYYSLINLCRWHGVILKGCNDKYDSERKLKALLDGEYKNEVWRFHNLLVETIEYNNFDLRKSIADGNAAPNTSTRR